MTHEIFEVKNVLPARLSGLRLDFGEGRWLDIMPLKQYQRQYGDAQLDGTSEGWIKRAEWFLRFGVKDMAGMEFGLATEPVTVLGRTSDVLTLECLDGIPSLIQEAAIQAITDLTAAGKLDEKRLDFTLDYAERIGLNATENAVSTATINPASPQ